MKFSAILLLACACALPVQAEPAAFSQDSAYAVLKFLAGEIGPRPMGSPAEHRGLAFAVSRFSAAGCQESSIMQFTEADGVNTNSGIAVGILRGETDRIIVIGGHMDSAGPDIQGANDDGSGAACVIELARVLGQRRNASTIVFCCWGGEERGLCGSTYFVKHFPLIDSVDLMLQIDMADGAGVIAPDPDAGYEVSAPTWLVDAAYEVFYRDLGYAGLRYPTQSATLNSASSGASGSDHQPFLEAGIPAIDFTSDVNYPIHSPLDNLENFTPSGLKRSGDLVLRLFERFDGGVPSRTTDRYLLVQIGQRPFFLHHWLLWLFVVISGATAAIALLAVRGRRPVADPAKKIRWSGAKVLCFTFMSMTLAWFSSNVVGMIRGYRFPWVNNGTGFLALALLSGLVGVWVALRLARTFRLTTDPSVYHWRAALPLALYTVGLCLLDVELASYTALALLLFSLAMLTPRSWLKLLLLLAAPYPVIRLIFFEELGLYQRAIMSGPGAGTTVAALFNLGAIVFFVVLFFPFVYGFAACYRDAGRDYFWLKRFRNWRGIVAVGVAIVALIVYLSSTPVYDHLWEPALTAEQRYVRGAERSVIVLQSGEYLSGLMVRCDGKDTAIAGRCNVDTLSPEGDSRVSWCDINVSSETLRKGEGSDSSSAVRRIVEIRSAIRPYQVRITYDSKEAIQLESSVISGGGRGLRAPSALLKRFVWYSFPDSSLIVPVDFTFGQNQEIHEKVEVIYDTLAYPVTMEKPLTYFSKRTIVTREESFSSPRATDRLAAAATPADMLSAGSR